MPEGTAAVLRGSANTGVRHRDGAPSTASTSWPATSTRWHPGETLDLQKLPPRLRAVVWVTGRQIRWETIKIMLDNSYLDAYRALHTAEPGFTFPAADPHVRLDYVFVPAAFAARLQACDVVADPPQAAAASDHLPLFADLDTD